MQENDVICIKFITDQEMYNQNNHIRVEYERLKQTHAATAGETVGVPHPVFLRIHAKEGHSYGMEKINGANLSQLTEYPDKYPDVIAIAKTVDREASQKDLATFVRKMHEGGVTHGDLFRRNLMLDTSGRLFVIDFGKAKIIEYAGDREEARKSDLYTADLALKEFFAELDKLS